MCRTRRNWYRPDAADDGSVDDWIGVLVEPDHIH